MHERSSNVGTLERVAFKEPVYLEPVYLKERMKFTMGGLSGRSSQTVLFIRHGKSETHAGKVAASSKRVPLTQEGKVQAKFIADRLERKPDLIVSSPYLRAWQTAGPTIRRFPKAPCKVWLDVQEFAYLGLLDGIPSSKEDRRELVEEYWTECNPSWNYNCEESESFTQFIQRTKTALDRLQKQKEFRFIVIFTHEQFIRAAQGLLEGWLKPAPDPANMWQFWQRLEKSPLPFGAMQVMHDGRIRDLRAYVNEEAGRGIFC